MPAIAIVINNKAQNHRYFQGLNDAKIAYNLYEASPEDLDVTIKECIV